MPPGRKGHEPRTGTQESLGALHRVMGERRLNIQDLARLSGLSYTTVFHLYHGSAQRIDLTTLDKLCGALNVAVGDLLEYVPDDPAA